jgi:N-carbamoylputrescine amidase
MSVLTRVAITQMGCDWNLDANLDRAEALLREAAAAGAHVVLLQELFATPYFCPKQKAEYFSHAAAVEGHPFLDRFASIARELGIVCPISFFEQVDNAYFNSMMMIDADGSMLGLYRKSHLPQCPGYEEKFYFSNGDTGFKVWETAHGRIGVGICWDQWFPECARSMALMGADLLLYPTAIGSEPESPHINSKDHWQRTMQGHAAANMVGLAASNRIGTEVIDDMTMTFYGHSFIADSTGGIQAEIGGEQGMATVDFDFASMRAERASWGLFRDRRTDLYGGLTSLYG